MSPPTASGADSGTALIDIPEDQKEDCSLRDGRIAAGSVAGVVVTPSAAVGKDAAKPYEFEVVRVAAMDLLFKTQPRIIPAGERLAAVKLVLSTIADRSDIDDAVRELMTDSVLFYARNHSSRRKDATVSSGFMETAA